MTHYLLFFPFAVSLFLSGCGSTPPSGGSTTTNDEVTVTKLVDEAQLALDLIKAQNIPGLPKVKHALIKVTASQGQTSSAGVGLVVTFSRSQARTNGRALELTLTPKPLRESFVDPIKSPGKILADDVIATMRAVNKQSDLRVGKLTVTADVKRTMSGSAGIEFEFSGYGISAEGSASRSRETLNSIQLVFER